MKLSPGLVLCEPLARKPQSDGGIQIPLHLASQIEEKQWRVLSVGPPRWVRNPKTKRRHLDPVEVQPGDRVLVEIGLGNRFAFDDGRRIFNASQILMKW